MNLPDCFCWTRFGTEAAQTIQQILARKEEERLANGGRFLWGIGNAIGPSLKALLQNTSDPEVLFSPMKGTPKSIDVKPEAVVAWTSGETLYGDFFTLPSCSLVTSRSNPATPKHSHYALVCHSDNPLSPSGLAGQVSISQIRNILTGRPVGASQVTAVVQQASSGAEDSSAYPVTVRAKLVAPYFVRLREHVPLTGSHRSDSWSEVVRSFWEARMESADTASDRTPQQEFAFE